MSIAIQRCVLVVLASCSFVVAVCQPANAPWPMSSQDRWGTGRAPNGPDPADYTLPWIFRVIAGDSRPSHAPVLDENGVGYYTGVNIGQLYKFDCATGNIITSFNMGGGAQGTAAIGDNALVYAGTDGGHQWAVFNSMASSLWDTAVGFVGSLTVGPGGDLVSCTSGGTVYRWNGLTGAFVWQKPGYGLVNGPTKFSRDDTKVFVASGNTMSCLNWSDGSQGGWQRDIGNTMGNVGVAPDGTVVAGSASGIIYGLDPTSGNNKWTVPSGSFTRAAPAFDTLGNAYVVTRDTGTLYSIRLSDGFVNWTFPTGATVVAPPIVGHDNRIYVVNTAGTLYSLATDSSIVWQKPLGSGNNAGPFSMDADGTIYAGNTRGGLAIVRQQSLKISPATLTMTTGSLLSGGVADLGQSDNVRAVLRPGPVLTTTAPPVRAVLSTTTAFRNLVSIKASIESAASQNGVVQTAELYNFVSGQYEQLSQIAVGTVDSTSAIADSSNPNRFVHSVTGDMRLRLSYKMTQPVLVFPWTVRLDWIRFDLVPQFAQS